MSVVFAAAQARAGEAAQPAPALAQVWGFDVAPGAAGGLGALLWALLAALLLALGALGYGLWRFVLQPQRRAPGAAPVPVRTA